jgi:putative peptidoglycan lipid II flippase
MFSVAVATVLFPALSRLAARADVDGFRRTVAFGLRQIAFLLVPASVVCAVLAEPIVRLVFQRGDFAPSQTPVVAGALAAFAIGLTFNGAMLMLNRGFFSLQLPWIPTFVALANLALNVVLDLVFYRLGVWGIPLATSVVNVAGTALLLVLMRRRLGGIEFATTGRAFALITLAAAALAAASYGIWWALDETFGRGLAGQLVSVLSAIAAGGAVYLAACRLLGVREIEALLSLRGRFRPA